MLTRVPCPSCGRDTINGPICEWCGKPLQPIGAPQPQAPPQAIPSSPQYSKNAQYSLICMICGGFFGLVTLFGVFRLAVNPWSFVFFGAIGTIGMFIIRIVTPAMICIALLRSGYDLMGRARRSRICSRCGGPLVLVTMMEDATDHTIDSGFVEYTYQCSQCGKRTTLVDG